MPDLHPDLILCPRSEPDDLVGARLCYLLPVSDSW